MRNHTYRCLQYHKTLIAKIGNKKVPHFAHKKGNACNGESYLHKLAKRRIREKIIPGMRRATVPRAEAGRHLTLTATLII